MNEKDPLEELFRREAEESLFQDKPREGVWQKIEHNLHEKKTNPIKDFVQGIWFSAAVFALIAVPYFYFFIENMNLREQNINLVKSTVDEILIQSKDSSSTKTEILDQLEENNPTEIVKNIPANRAKNPEIINPQADIIEKRSKQIDSIVSTTKDEELTNINLKETKSFERRLILDSVTSKSPQFASAAKMATTTVDVLQVEKEIKKKNEPLQVLPSRFIVQDEINRASFEYIKNSGNRIIFSNGSIKMNLERKNGVVKVSTNSEYIKPEILSVITSNKEMLFNYYINYKKK